MVEAPSAQTVLPNVSTSSRNARKVVRLAATRLAKSLERLQRIQAGTRLLSEDRVHLRRFGVVRVRFATMSEKLPPLMSLNSTSTIFKPSRVGHPLDLLQRVVLEMLVADGVVGVPSRSIVGM